MIEQISIRNFQCHHLLVANIDPQIHVIEGSSDSGKSAIIRALEWVRTNRPKGSAFVRHGENKCTVSISTPRGSVRRIRSGDSNKYIIAPSKGSPETFSITDEEAMRRVWDILRISDINVQSQHDPPFLLSDSPGEVARKLNGYADLSEVDETRDTLHRGLAKRKSALEGKEGDLSDVVLGLKRFEVIQETESKLQQARALYGKVDKDQEEIHSLTDLMNEIPLLEAQIPPISTERLQELQEGLTEQGARLESLEHEEKSLATSINQIQILEEELDASGIPVDLPEQLETAQGLWTSCKESSKQLETLRLLVQDLISIRQLLQESTTEYDQMAVEWEEIKQGACPTCGQGLEGMK